MCIRDRLDTPTSGTVIVRDKELSKMNDEQLTILDVYKRQVLILRVEQRIMFFLLMIRIQNYVMQ